MAMVKYSYCRLCEGACGIKAMVEGDRVVAIEPDPENELSRGFACVKGTSAAQILDHPARVLHPMQRDGTHWRRAGWDEALPQIAAALNRIRGEHGPDAVALYLGNPTAMSAVAALVASSFLRSLGSSRQYSAMSLDNMNKFWVAEEMFGDKSFILQRDWENARYMLVLGSNPRVSIFGQLATRPRGLDEVRKAQAGGGKLVLVDPRRTETATIADEHLRIVPGTDVFLLLALLHTVVREERHDRAFVARYCRNFALLGDLLAPYAPEAVAPATGIDAASIRRIARELASAGGGFVVGNTGVTQQPFSTVSEWAIETLNAVTGNVDRPGGIFFNPGIVDDPHAKRSIEWNRRSRIGGYPRILGEYPMATLADEILTPGAGQVRALIVTAGNPLATAPDTRRMAAALRTLDLLVVIDLFRSPSAEAAHWILPATSFLERKDVNVQFTRHMPFPFAQYTEAVTAPRGEARDEWRIFRDLHAAVGTPFLDGRGPASDAPGGNADYDIDSFYADFLARRGRVGLAEIRRHPHGLKLGDKPFGAFRASLDRRGWKIDLAPASVVAVIPRLEQAPAPPPDRPLRLISRRNLRSVCSWMHFDAAGVNELEMSEHDAERRRISTGERVRVRSEIGELTAQVKVTDRVPDGVVSLQYGFSQGLGADDGAEGVTMNRLIPRDTARDPLTGMPMLNGIPVQVSRMS